MLLLLVVSSPAHARDSEWVPVPGCEAGSPSIVAQGNELTYCTKNRLTPEKVCQQAGYSEASGACKAIFHSVLSQGALTTGYWSDLGLSFDCLMGSKPTQGFGTDLSILCIDSNKID